MRLRPWHVTIPGARSVTTPGTGVKQYPVASPTSSATPAITLSGPTPSTRSLTVVVEYIVLRTGSPVGRLTTILPGGYITIDVTATTLRTLQFSCLDPQHVLAPTTTGGLLNPDSGVEIQVRLGFQQGTTEPVMWTQGVFLVVTTQTSTSAATINSGGGLFPGPGPNLMVEGWDRSKRISLNLFETPFRIAANTNIGTAIESILAAQAPWVTHPNITPTTNKVAAQVYNVGTDPWEKIVTLAVSAGMVAYFDATGTLVVRPAPALGGAPTALQLIDGPTQVAMSMTRITSATPGYNGVIVIGSSAAGTNGFQGSAFTLNPSSKLYATGPYGRRPAPPVTLATATSNAQCQQIAQAILSQYLGLSQSIIADMVPAPFLDAYDLIFARNRVTNTTDLYILQQSTRYLDYSQQEAITCVPLGSPISQLTWLQTPSIAAYGSTNQLFVGGATWTPVNGWTYRTTPTWTVANHRWKTNPTGTAPAPFLPWNTWLAANTPTWTPTNQTWKAGPAVAPAGTTFGGVAGLGQLGFGGGWGLVWGGGFQWRKLLGGQGGSTSQLVPTEAQAIVELP